MGQGMGCRQDQCGGTRAQRRALRREDRRGARAQARWRKGQTLIIFALSITMLLGMAGLAIDVARAFDLYAKMQRAAEAGALAGVLYMPNYYNAARLPGDGLSAVDRAMQEIYKDGFGTGSAAIPASNPCPTPVNSVEIAICQPSTQPSDLEVYITEHLNVTLLGGLGVAPITLTVKAQADYLPPVQIGSRQNYFGDQMECTTDNITFTACDPSDTTQTHVQSFVALSNGPAELKESGDPMVYCAEGPAVLSPPGTDPTTSSLTYNGYGTNHPQWPGVPNSTTYTGGISQYCGQPVPGGNPGNPDYQPAGYNGPMTAGTPHPGGYNYIISVTPAISSASLWLFNPYYIPRGGSAIDHFVDNGTAGNFYQGPRAEGIGSLFDGSHHDAPLFFFNTTFTLYQVTNLYDRTSDVQVWSQTYQPYDDTSADLTQHTCPAGTIYDPTWSGGNTDNTYYKPNGIPAGGGCTTSPTCEPVLSSTWYNTWCEALQPGSTTPVSLTPGIYRLVVEVTGLSAKTPVYNSTLQDGWGSHGYGIKLCSGLPATAVNCNGGGASGSYTNTNLTIFGWNNVDTIFEQKLGSAAPNPNVPSASCVSGTTQPYACMDFGCIPTAYAGRTVTAGLYDPGDGSGDLYIGVVQPPGSGSTVTISYPSYATVLSGSAYDGDTVVQAHVGSTGYRPFNGLWLPVTIQFSPSYVGDCTGTSSPSGWFQVVYMSNTGGNPSDGVALEFTLVGSPVHLVLALG